MEQAKLRKVTTFLMFESGAEKAARLYTSVFPDSEITEISYMGEGAERSFGICELRDRRPEVLSV